MATIGSFKTRAALLIVGALLSFQGASACRPGGSGKLTSGTELVFQVQDAFAAAADSAIERLRTDLRAEKIQVADDAITRTEPKTVEDAAKLAILIKGVPEPQASSFRNVVNRPAYSQWTLSPVNAPSAYKMTLTPTAAAQVRIDTLHAAMSVIERRMDALGFQANGLALKMWIGPAAHYPDAPELIVQFSPVDDPSPVVEVLKTGGVMEWDAVDDGPFVTREEALAKHAGALPPNTKIVPEVPRDGGHRYWIVSSHPVIRGSDLIGATAAGEMPGWGNDFTLSPEAAKRFEAYTSASIGKQAALIVDGLALSVPTIQSTIRDHCRITGARTQQEAADLAIVLRASLPARLIALEQRRIGSNPESRTPNPERTQ